MAQVTRSADASIDPVSWEKVPQTPQLADLVAGEALDVAAPCYINSTDGKVYMSNGTLADEEAEVAGFTPRAYKVGKPVTLVGAGAVFLYSDDFSAESVSPGDKLFLAAANGVLDTVAQTGNPGAVAIALDNEHIIVALWLV